MTNQSMRYVAISQPGGPEVLQIKNDKLVPNPNDLASNEVLIAVKAAGVNRPDILQRKGLYPPPAGASPILGLEVAGDIVAWGKGITPKILQEKFGDKNNAESIKNIDSNFQIRLRHTANSALGYFPVVALVAGGGYAEYCVAPIEQCLPKPKNLNYEQAAGIPETFFTVWFNLFMRAGLKAGERVLIHGGASGIGTTAIMLARRADAEIFVTAGTDEKCQKCNGLGAHHSINYKQKDFVKEINELTHQKGVDVIVDMVAGDYFARNLECLAQDGRLVQIATQQGEKVALSLRTVMLKGITLVGSTLRPRSVEQKGNIAEALLQNVWPALCHSQQSSSICPIVDRVFALAEASEAHAYLESGAHFGKVILKIDPI